MKCHLAVLLVLSACAGLAHADSNISAILNINGPIISCNKGASSSTAIDLRCNTSSDPDWGFVTGSVSATSVSAVSELQTGVYWDGQTWAYGQADFQLSMNGLYILRGGTGSGLATWSLDTESADPEEIEPASCSVMLNGFTEQCDSAVEQQTGSFYVPYNVPLLLSFTGYRHIASIGSMEAGPAGMTFTLTNLEPFAEPTPEPSAALLTATGLLGLIGAATIRRAKLGVLTH